MTTDEKPVIIDLRRMLNDCPKWWINFVRSTHPPENDIPEDYDFEAAIRAGFAPYGIKLPYDHKLIAARLVFRDEASYMCFLLRYEY